MSLSQTVADQTLKKSRSNRHDNLSVLKLTDSTTRTSNSNKGIYSENHASLMGQTDWLTLVAIYMPKPHLKTIQK